MKPEAIAEGKRGGRRGEEEVQADGEVFNAKEGGGRGEG